MNNVTNKKEVNYLKANLLFLFIDLFSLGSYFGFQELFGINTALSTNASEIIVNEGAFFTFIVLFMVAFHFIIIIGVHTPLSKKSYGYKEKFYKISIISTFSLALFSGYIVSYHVEEKLKQAEYHFCENLSYTESYKITHYVWRNKNTDCNIILKKPQTQ